MTNQAEPGRLPAHDLTAFDLSRRSPEQLAQSFARWKARRKRPPEETHAAAPAGPKPLPSSANRMLPGDETPKHALRKPATPVQYSALFSALLAAGSEPAVQRLVTDPIAPRPALKRNASSGLRLKALSVVAGAASVFALAGGALLELSGWRDLSDAEPEAVWTPATSLATPIAMAATRAPAKEWELQRTVDLALMKAPAAGAAPAVQQTPTVPAVQTASKAASAEGKPVPPRPAPARSKPEAVQFLAKPFVPSVAADPTSIPEARATSAPPVAAVLRSGDPRPDALFQHGLGSASGTESSRTAFGGKPAEATGAQGRADATSTTARSTAMPAATARTGSSETGGNADPRGEGTGGARVRPDVAAGAAGGGDDAGAAPDTSGGNTGGSAADGGSGAAAGGDAGGADTASDSGDGASSDDAGNGNASSGDAISGNSDSGDGEDGNPGGIGGAIGGALGGIGGAVGDALGGGSSKADSEGE